MNYSEQAWRKSKRGSIIRTNTERICRVFHDHNADGSADEVALGNQRLILQAVNMYKLLLWIKQVLEGNLNRKQDTLVEINAVLDQVEGRIE